VHGGATKRLAAVKRPEAVNDAARADAWKQKFARTVAAKATEEQIEFEKRLQQQYTEEYTKEVHDMLQSTTTQKQVDRELVQTQLQEIQIRESCVQRQCVELSTYVHDLNAWHVRQLQEQQDREEQLRLAILMAEKELHEQQRMFAHNFTEMMQHTNTTLTTHNKQPPCGDDAVTVDTPTGDDAVTVHTLVTMHTPIGDDAVALHASTGDEEVDDKHAVKNKKEHDASKYELGQPAISIGDEAMYPVYNEFIFF
jgi:hypothetical protein